MVDVDPASLGIKIGPPPTDYEIVELVLHPGARVNRFEEKAAFVPMADLYQLATPPDPTAEVVAKSDVIDLTPRCAPTVRSTGRLPPAIGSSSGSAIPCWESPTIRPPPEATGLEVDKLNRGFVKNYMDTYLDSYKQTVGADYMGKRGIRYVINDSWEAGSQNWTDDMIAQFKKRRGYDPLPWMPVLTGQVVESAEASDRFLWDFRKTIGDLIANEHYGQLEATLHEWGMGHYGESHEGGRAFVADGMEVKKFNEVPMSAMWTQVPGVNKEQYVYNADDRESASVAHIYGQNLAAAESMTAAAAPLGMVAGDAEADCGSGAAERDQPLCDSRVGAPAAGGQGAGNDSGALRAVVQSQRNLGGTSRSLGELHRAQQLSAPAGALRRGPGLLLRRRLEPHGDL